MNEKLTRPYNPAETEDRIYQKWEEGGYFQPEIQDKLTWDNPNKDKRFSIVLPPPNVTGTLHIGHAAMLVIEDIMIRFRRMQGYRTLWVPGTDHASIATQTKVEKIISKEGLRRSDLGREKFLERVEQFVVESRNTIVNQSRKMGASLDWSREAYTLDEPRSLAVRTAFKRMYDLGLIVRGTRVVNWCPRCASTLADDEIEYKQGKATLYTFKYSKDLPFSIATTRPETKLGDTGIAVNPGDARYKQYIGKTFIVDLGHGPQELKVVADIAVDPEFGTGALGVTPAHSAIDERIAKKNGLPSIVVIDQHGRMTREAGAEYEGLKVKEAREKFVAWLRNQGLMEKEEEVDQNLSVCYRCETPIEPLPMLQWFVDVNKKVTIPGNQFFQNKSIREVALSVVQDKKIEIIPDRFKKNYYHWLENLQDWCISRQIWFGHRIPVWYRSNGTSNEQEVYCGVEAPEGEGWEQDPDTLDTWFSSGLWTFSTLGWPDTNAPDFKMFHPISVMETAYDILFFWVARMIIMTTLLVGDIPFRTTYLHGLVRDEKGRKMSKSLGNVLDPLDLIAKYGTDAVRLSLIIGTGPGNDSKVSEDKIRGYKNFANKIWNISRFILSNCEDIEYDPNFNEYSETDIKLGVERNKIIEDITSDLEKYRFYLAGEKLYHYTWHRLADEIIEESKLIFRGADQTAKLSRQQFLLHTLAKLLIVLHPFIPFITEEIWSMMPIKDKQLLIITKWPV
jgi:valyl-tRNA synthetase